MSEMRYLQPDDVDRNMLLFGMLRKCPFCGGTPATINRVNDDTKIFRSLISCSKCTAQVGYNARDLDEARREVIERWNTRHT
jgi:Lar family restriction alleviation protein